MSGSKQPSPIPQFVPWAQKLRKVRCTSAKQQKSGVDLSAIQSINVATRIVPETTSGFAELLHPSGRSKTKRLPFVATHFMVIIDQYRICAERPL